MITSGTREKTEISPAPFGVIPEEPSLVADEDEEEEDSEEHHFV